MTANKPIMIAILILALIVLVIVGFATGGPSPEDLYKEAYAQVVEQYHAENDEYKFDLVDTDADGVQELVADLPGYQMSLFTYEDGAVRCLMDHWPYGAMGNAGYSYLPEEGIYCNTNSDMAGAIRYTYFMSKHEEGELATDYWVEAINFIDLDGDGIASEEELEASEDYEGTLEYYNETDVEMSESELKEKVDGYFESDMEELVGILSYDSIMKKLNS
jgi:hypothetical protein